MIKSRVQNWLQKLIRELFVASIDLAWNSDSWLGWNSSKLYSKSNTTGQIPPRNWFRLIHNEIQANHPNRFDKSTWSSSSPLHRRRQPRFFHGECRSSNVSQTPPTVSVDTLLQKQQLPVLPNQQVKYPSVSRKRWFHATRSSETGNTRCHCRLGRPQQAAAVRATIHLRFEICEFWVSKTQNIERRDGCFWQTSQTQQRPSNSMFWSVESGKCGFMSFFSAPTFCGPLAPCKNSMKTHQQKSSRCFCFDECQHTKRNTREDLCETKETHQHRISFSEISKPEIQSFPKEKCWTGNKSRV